MEHTPTPWTNDDNEIYDGATATLIGIMREPPEIPYDYDKDMRPAQPTAITNAAFIVKACNNYEALVEALKVYASPDNWSDDDWGIRAVHSEYGNAGEIARAALEAAGEL